MGASIGRHPRRLALVVTAMAGVLLAACGPGTTGQSSTPKNGGTLVWGLDADAQSLNPFVAGDLPSARSLAFMFPNLYSADKNINIVPDLADGMPQVSSDGKVWTVKLKSGAKWTDGSPITADDVVTTVNLQNNPNLDTDAGFDWGVLEKVEKADTLTVKFTLTSPFAPFLADNLQTPRRGDPAPREVGPNTADAGCRPSPDQRRTWRGFRSP
jgi:peptide/nickel transport system substrate-binding protein